MPELPEVEIVARRLDRAIGGVEVESALAPGMVTMKTIQPPLDSLAGRTVTRVRRIGKMPVVEFGELSLLVHLMSAGRLQLFDKRAGPRDRTSNAGTAGRKLETEGRDGSPGVLASTRRGVVLPGRLVANRNPTDRYVLPGRPCA